MFNENLHTGDSGHTALHNNIARHLNSELNARAYGAKGDGVTDDTTTIRNAIASLPARTTKARVVLDGSFLVSGTITIPAYTILELRGKITLKNSSNVTMLSIAASNVEICGGGEIDGNRANQSAGVGILANTVQDVLIHDIYIHDAKEQNIRVLGNSTRVDIRNIRGVDGEAGNIYFLQATNPPQLEITDSTIEGCTLYYTTPIASVANIGLENCRRIRVANNHCYGAADFGVHCEEHLYDSLITSNIVTGHQQDGIRIGYSERNVIAMNTANQNGWRGISLSQGSNQNTVVMNTAQENGKSGVLFEDCRNNLVADNNAMNNNQSLDATYNAGIQILTLGSYVPQAITIRGNIAGDNQTAKTQQYGISANGDSHIIEDNDVRGNALEPFNNILRSDWVTTHSKVRRNLGGYGLLTFNAGDTTPSVAIGIELFETSNTTPTIITMFDDGERGQVINVDIKDAFTTIDFSGTHLKGNGGVDWSPANGDWMQCVFNGTDWKCAVYDAT